MKLRALLALAFCLSPLSSFAASSWQCEGNSIEGLEISEHNGQLTGFVSWDCFPGDGICRQDASVRVSSDEAGNVVAQGSYFKLVIETTKELNADGEYKAYIFATDMTDSSDQGRGLKLGEEVFCKEGAL